MRLELPYCFRLWIAIDRQIHSSECSFSGTRFDVMNEIQRRQTTKGIWMALAKPASPQLLKSSLAEDAPASSPSTATPNILVLDVEGTDGRERGEDQDFERKSALFALATSEVLIVNMWESQVGLYQGANMGLLKTVFEVNLTLFQNASTKPNRSRILFVIRDHIGTTPLANLQATVVADLKRIWESLSKPPPAANSSLDDFFDLQFYALPHKILMPEQFSASTAQLSNTLPIPRRPHTSSSLSTIAVSPLTDGLYTPKRFGSRLRTTKTWICLPSRSWLRVSDVRKLLHRRGGRSKLA